MHIKIQAYDQAMSVIAVIDNDRDVLRMMDRMLSEGGHQCLTFHSGAEALAAISRTAVDLVITDIYMPHMDGLEVLDQIVATFPDLPVVAMSGGGSLVKVDMLPDARAAGAKAILDKPFTHDQLIGTVASALRRR
jgi:DNA-binding NtrC family response regulator